MNMFDLTSYEIISHQSFKKIAVQIVTEFI